MAHLGGVACEPCASRPEYAKRCATRRARGVLPLITEAFAQTAAAPGGGADMLMQTMVPFAIVLVIMYFLVMRPQQTRAKQQAEMLKNIRRGDTVVTTGGVIGKVTKATDDSEVEVEIAPNVRIRQSRGMIAEVRAKGEPVKEAANDKGAKA
jgi:preprotein translocase subunit YajC